jgi:hypothetical protein
LLQIYWSINHYHISSFEKITVILAYKKTHERTIDISFHLNKPKLIMMIRKQRKRGKITKKENIGKRVKLQLDLVYISKKMHNLNLARKKTVNLQNAAKS